MNLNKFYRPEFGSRYKNDCICCPSIKIFTWGGAYENELNLVYLPFIRGYVIFDNPCNSKGNFTPIDYCPFCGAKFPERLDEKLSEILQNEYGLESWRDYKKAPHEFWTDEWWKKRHIGPDENGL